MDTYDPRYLAGVVLFNEQDFFGAHEVWEDLWHQELGPANAFVQGLIQFATALHHFEAHLKVFFFSSFPKTKMDDKKKI